jgi:hypothetical protein
MCKGCGRVRYTQSSFGPGVVPDGYRTEETVEIVWTGGGDLRVTGCKSGARYIFLSGRTRIIDRNDAECLILVNGFEWVESIPG